MARSNQSGAQNSFLVHSEDLWIPRVQGGDIHSTQCLHCAVNTCAGVLGEGGIRGETKSFY